MRTEKGSNMQTRHILDSEDIKEAVLAWLTQKALIRAEDSTTCEVDIVDSEDPDFDTSDVEVQVTIPIVD